MIRYTLMLSLLLSIMACQNSGTNGSTGNISTAEFNESEQLTTTSGQYVVNRSTSGTISEEGFLRNGQKEGAWITYNPDGQIETVTTYVGGQLNGIFLEFDQQYRLVSKTGYKNNEFHGMAKKFKFNRVIEELPYQNGQLEGIYRKYFENNGKLQIEAEYSNGVQNGLMRYYNSEGRPTMEYTYENGKQVSGGIVETPPAEAAQ